MNGAAEADREVVIATIVDERAAIMAHRRAKSDAIDRAVKAGRIDADTGNAITRALETFVDDIAIGLHRPDEAWPALRAAMKAKLAEKADG